MTVPGDAEKGPGTVYLVGAGPGDSGLLTLQGSALLVAEVIVVDRLARPVLESGPMDSLLGGPDPPEIIDVGKAPRHGGWPQERINALLVEKARTGKNVIRLKGGDPFIFGRGHEELRACRAAGIPCVVVPGLSSVTAAPALAGIPLVLRGVSSSFHVMTGHLGETPGDEGTRWREAGRLEGTLVILMAMDRLRFIADELMEGGKAPDTPCAVIERASLPGQKMTIAALRELGGKADEIGAKAPGVVVIGEVVNHRVDVEAPRPSPLLGRRVAVTAPQDSSREISTHLRALGAECSSVPMFSYHPVELDREQVEGILTRARACDHLLFTSARAVWALSNALLRFDLDFRRLGEGVVIAVGRETAAELERQHREHSVLRPVTAGAEGLKALLRERGAERVLWLRGREARAETREAIREGRADVEEAIVYESTAQPEGPERLRELLDSDGIDAVVFKSPRAVEAALGVIPAEQRQALTQSVCLAAIGPTTASALESLGLGATVVASEPSDSALAAAMADHFEPGWDSQ